MSFLYFQITVWDYVRYGANDFLGEVLFELSNHPLDDEPEWYILHGHQETHIHTVCSLIQFVLISIFSNVYFVESVFDF